MTAPLLIIETGRPVAPMRRHGSFAHWIRVAAGLGRDQAVVVDAQGPEPLPRREGFAGVIVTGSAAMVTDRLDWSERCATWLAAAAGSRLPVLGICYGHQLLAHALGGTVGDNPRGREMGTVCIDTTADAATDPVFASMPPRFVAQLTHIQSVLEPPPGAVVLARNDHDACQAFRVGAAAWGVQFHPEFSAMHMRGYIRARAPQLRAEGADPAAMLADVRATPLARSVLRRFVLGAQRRASAPVSFTPRRDLAHRDDR